MEFATEYTAGRIKCRPSTWNGSMPLLEVIFVIIIRPPFPGEPKLTRPWKLTLMIYPMGTVIFQIHLLYGGKAFGKFGLEKNPLESFRNSP